MKENCEVHYLESRTGIKVNEMLNIEYEKSLDQLSARKSINSLNNCTYPKFISFEAIKCLSQPNFGLLKPIITMSIKSFPHVCQTQVAFAETLDAKIVSVHHSNQNSCNPCLCSVLSL